MFKSSQTSRVSHWPDLETWCFVILGAQVILSNQRNGLWRHESGFGRGAEDSNEGQVTASDEPGFYPRQEKSQRPARLGQAPRNLYPVPGPVSTWQQIHQHVPCQPVPLLFPGVGRPTPAPLRHLHLAGLDPDRSPRPCALEGGGHWGPGLPLSLPSVAMRLAVHSSCCPSVPTALSSCRGGRRLKLPELLSQVSVTAMERPHPQWTLRGKSHPRATHEEMEAHVSPAEAPVTRVAVT